MKLKLFRKNAPIDPSNQYLGFLLKGRQLGQPLSYGPLEMIPLKGSPVQEQLFVGPETALVWHSSPQLKIANESDQRAIVPLHLANVEFGMPGQALCSAHLLEAGAEYTVGDACSLSMPDATWNMFSGDQLIALPFSLRAAAFKMRGIHGHSKLWPNILKLQETLGLSEGCLPKKLREQYLGQLLEAYEKLGGTENQTGAVFSLAGEIIGIELAPDAEFWKEWYPSLLMYGYAPLCLFPEFQEDSETKRPFSLDLEGIRSIRALKDEYEARKTLQLQNADRKIAELSPMAFEYSVDQMAEYETLVRIEADYFAGQAVVLDQHIAYLSLFHQNFCQI